MLYERNGQSPRIRPSAKLAPSAQIIGDVIIGEHSYIDYNVVIESSGAPIRIGDGVLVLANTVIRSVGGSSRPPFPVQIGDHTLISPLCALAGCQIGGNCYIATGVVILQGAVVGDVARVGAGAIVHANTVLPPRARIGIRNIAVPTEEGFWATSDIEAARKRIAAAEFFSTAFDEKEQDQAQLQANVIAKLLQETLEWNDLSLG